MNRKILIIVKIGGWYIWYMRVHHTIIYTYIIIYVF